MMAFGGQQYWRAIGLVLLATFLGVQSYAVPQASVQEPSAQRLANQNSANLDSDQALFDQADTLIKGTHYSEAVSLLRSAIKRFPDQARFHHYLGYALWKLARWQEAQAEFEKAHALDPKNPYTCYFLARTAVSLGQTDHAISYYKEVLQLGPAIYDTNQRLGQAYLDKGDLEQARAKIQAALEETPWDGSLYYQLGRIDQRQHHSAQARQEFAASSRLKDDAQKFIRQLLALAEAVHNHQADRIQQIRAELLSQDFPDPEMYDSIGVLLGRGGLYSEALEPLERSVKLAPNSYQSNYDLGLTLFKLGRTQEAEAQLKKALALQPGSLAVNRLLGLIYVNQNRNPEAIERLRAASLSAPGDARVLALLGEQYLVGHYVAEAVQCLTEAVRQNPDNPALRDLLIEAYQDQKDLPKALQTAQEAAARFPDNPRFAYEEGQQLANIGDYQKALPYAEKAIKMDPTLHFAYDLMGDILARSGQYAAALTNFRKARNIMPGDELALKGIAENLIHLERYPEALTGLKQAIAVRPQDANLYFSLMQVYVRLGRREDAAQAQAVFQKLRARAAAERNAQSPRQYKPSAGSGTD